MRSAVAIVLAVWAGLPAWAAGPLDLREPLERPGIVRHNGDVVFGGLTWRRDNNPNGELGPADGGGLRLTVRKGAYETARNGEGHLHDRSEMRESRARYLPPGTPVWYAVSIRATPDLPRSPGRLVILQLKTPYAGHEDASPALALRLEDRRLFATVEQLLLPGQADRLVPAVDGRCPPGMALASPHVGSDTPQIRVLLAVEATGLPSHRVPQYRMCTPFVTLVPGVPLPPLGMDWTDVRVFTQTGLAGKVELWVNGVYIASATGPFGDADPKGQQYFKFGPYRDKAEETLSLDFARFRRAGSAEGLGD
jgi:hypothetical protein